MDCYIWAIVEDGGWDWIKTCLRDRDSRTPYAYNIRRFPQKSDIIVFYSKNRFHGRITVAEAGREVTPTDTEVYSYLKGWKYVMFLDGRTIRMFHQPVNAKDVSEQIKKLKGKTDKPLHDACRNDPLISMDEYKRIIEKGYQKVFNEFMM